MYYVAYVVNNIDFYQTAPLGTHFVFSVVVFVCLWVSFCLFAVVCCFCFSTYYTTFICEDPYVTASHRLLLKYIRILRDHPSYI